MKTQISATEACDLILLGPTFWGPFFERQSERGSQCDFQNFIFFSFFPYGNRMLISKYWSWLIFHLSNISENLNLQFGSRWNFSHQLHHEKKKYLNEWQNGYASNIPWPATQILSLNTESYNLMIFGAHNLIL